MVEGRVAAGPSGILGRASSSCGVGGRRGHATDGVSEPRDGSPLASARRGIEVASGASEDKGDTFPWLGDVSRGARRAAGTVRPSGKGGVVCCEWRQGQLFPGAKFQEGRNGEDPGPKGSVPWGGHGHHSAGRVSLRTSIQIRGRMGRMPRVRGAISQWKALKTDHRS